ncbi:MAG: sulfotransferase [Desulfobacteraceae bacterium]|jgi:hypothetical protein
MKSNIKNWPQFAKKVRKKKVPLLKELDNFPASILIAGCQRSGTTMLARIITQSEGMVNYWFGRDDELDAALILSGTVPHTPSGRYCFQTTYLNENYPEYFEHNNGHKLIWVLRNPYSVVYSMKYNWRGWALNELFEACGVQFLDETQLKRYQRFGVIGIPKILRACLSYKGKTIQIEKILEKFGKDRVLVIEYDDLIQKKEVKLEKVYQFLGLAFKKKYADLINAKSLHKSDKLSKKEKSLVLEHAFPTYEKVKKLVQP